jgi:glycine dehydrogenase subunit 1
MNYRVGHTPQEEEEMLKTIGLSSFEDLLQQIPGDQRYSEPLDLPPALSEAELKSLFTKLSRKNYDAAGVTSFLGAGYYDHDRPAVVGHMIQRSEFATAYTPYQAEVSQGTLASIFEFQTAICELTGLDVANASLYDGGSACGEALWMALGATRRKKVLLAESLNPCWRRVVKTYLGTPDVAVEILPAPGGILDPVVVRKALTPEVAAVLVQHPNVYGLLEQTDKLGEVVHGTGAHLVACCDPVSLALLEPPGSWGAASAVGEGQSLAIPPSYGGPTLGFMAARKEFMRRMPGRIVAEAVDVNGDRGFVLTLQTREQHIRRAKATSNICTNSNLVALAMLISLSLLGPGGLREMAELSFRKAWRARERLLKIPGVTAPYDGPFFREFLLELPRDAEQVVLEIYRRVGLLAGVPGSRLWKDHPHRLLVAVTEKRTDDEIEELASALEGVLAS